MGIIQRQSIKSSIVDYIGVAIGALSVLFIYPLHKEIYGYLQFLYSTSAFLIPFASLGTLALAVKFFPAFKDKKSGHNGFFILLFLLFCAAYLVFLVICLNFKEYIIKFLEIVKVDPEGKIGNNLYYVLVIIFFMGIRNLLASHSSNYQRIVMPSVTQSILYKIWIPITVLLFYQGYLTRNESALGLIAYYISASLILIIYLKHIGALDLARPNFAKLTGPLKRKMSEYALFGGLNTLGNLLAFKIDSIMISTMIGFSSNGLYFIMVFLSNVIEVPYRSVQKIAGPIISESWETEDRENIKNIYGKSSINLLILGIPIFLMIWSNLGALEAISGNQGTFSTGKYIFLFIGLGKLASLMTGVCNQILFYSDKFKYSLYLLIILGMSNIFLNYYLIDMYGVNGAAFASMFSYVLYNFLSMLLVWIFYRFQPLEVKSLIVAFIGALVFLLISLIPEFTSPYFTLFGNVVLIGLLYFPVVYFLNLSEDINRMILNCIQKARSIF